MDIVRRADRPRYLATLFAPAEVRDDLFALYAFAAEVARIPDLVSEPTLGEIRLAWWRERLEAGGAEGEGSPVLAALFAAVERRRLPVQALLALIDARSSDLYADPPATTDDLEGRLGETESTLFQMAAIVTGGDKAAAAADASGHAGVAYGLTRRLGAFHADRARGRTIAPTAMLAERQIDIGSFDDMRSGDQAEAVIGDLAALARRHLNEIRQHLADLSSDLRPAFLPLAVVPSWLDRLEARPKPQTAGIARPSNLAMLARIAWAAIAPGWRMTGQ